MTDDREMLDCAPVSDHRRLMSTHLDPIDDLHAECLALRSSIRQHAAALHAEVREWEPAPCPPRPDRPLTKQQAAWLNTTVGDRLWDDETLKVWDADDPLLRPRPWLR